MNMKAALSDAYSQNSSQWGDTLDECSAMLTRRRDQDPVDFVRATEAYSFNHEDYAEKYVDAVILKAIEELTPKPKSYKLPDIVVPILDEIVDRAAPMQSNPSSCQNLCPIGEGQPSWSNVVKKESLGRKAFSGWPRVSEFNIKLGLEKLEEYIETWERSKEWMCCVEFLGFESEESGNYFIYEVEFSTPTPAYPVPQATASVYFSLEVSKILPPACDRPIQVSYLFESTNVVHIPGKIDFQECWIRDIIQCKLHVFKCILF